MNFLDDRSRLAVASSCSPVKAADVVRIFYSASNKFGLPASVLSDKGAVFTGKQRRGKVLLELELERLGIACKHSHALPPSDSFRAYYNNVRPHRALNRQPPMTVFDTLIKARPALVPPPLDYRVRREKIDARGAVTLRS